VYLAVLKLLSCHQDFQQLINSIHSELKGYLSIGITDCLITLPRMYITDSLKALKHHAPEVNINIEMIPANQVIKSLLDGQIQIGVAPVFSKNPNLTYVHLYDEETYLYCGHEHPLFNVSDKNMRAEQMTEHEIVSPSYQQSPESKKHLNGFSKSAQASDRDRKSTRLNSRHITISYAVFCLKKQNTNNPDNKKGQLKRSRYNTNHKRT